jgi:excisionase family DNA binding protein
MYKELTMKAYLNASEVAKLLNVDRATVTRWLKRGLIPNAVRVMDKQQWRIPLSSYEELVRQQHHHEGR